ncbi:histidine phosphatase family protein [Motiliproteus sp. MSK22-1]|uniref:histidine phosphatase family protein n=1 Tax=Motiliproteus sp. MSK22-1 TaxID=1897630 RepID=UPI0009759C6A|nr:histidine phosphatase family protein [Motiliproteus sp. MSK22-1]OMH30300.1 hypothetical protein BGP75_18085 [Motiliproteus sp. MSK22-1]
MKSSPEQAISFYFVRHAETKLNRQGLRCGGDVDVPLTETGCKQAFQLGEQIRKMDLDIGKVLTSPLIRTRQTALLISGVLEGVSIAESPLLKERLLGEWNKQPIIDTEPLLHDRQTPPGGESEAQFRLRMQRALEWFSSFLDQPQDQRLLLVGSKGVGRVLYSLLGGEERLLVGNAELLRFEVSRSEGNLRCLKVQRLLSK